MIGDKYVGRDLTHIGTHRADVSPALVGRGEFSSVLIASQPEV